MTTEPERDLGEPRLLEIAPNRIDRWLTGFDDRHGPSRREVHGDRIEVTAQDGSVAVLEAWSPHPGATHPDGALQDWAAVPPVLALILIRRGGYSIGWAVDGSLVAHKTGTRYVQGKTKKGGSSQQRFARRRGNQADALVGSAVSTIRAVRAKAMDVTPAARRPQGVVLGGDRKLCALALADLPDLQLADQPVREFYDLPDPRLVVLQQALERAHAVRVTLREVAGE